VIDGDDIEWYEYKWHYDKILTCNPGLKGFLDRVEAIRWGTIGKYIV
jgi:hypothetical protein